MTATDKWEWDDIILVEYRYDTITRTTRTAIIGPGDETAVDGRRIETDGDTEDR